MSKASSSGIRQWIGASVLAIAAALVLVPTVARASQHVDRRDATRLSIKHSWLGVAPPSKSSLASGYVMVPARAAVESDRGDIAQRLPVFIESSPRDVPDSGHDAQRGPPAASLA